MRSKDKGIRTLDIQDIRQIKVLCDHSNPLPLDLVFPIAVVSVGKMVLFYLSNVYFRIISHLYAHAWV